MGCVGPHKDHEVARLAQAFDKLLDTAVVDHPGSACLAQRFLRLPIGISIGIKPRALPAADPSGHVLLRSSHHAPLLRSVTAPSPSRAMRGCRRMRGTCAARTVSQSSACGLPSKE